MARRKKLSKRLQRKIAKRAATKVWRIPRDPAVKFTLFCRPKGTQNKPWSEDYVVETKDPEGYAQKLIDVYNRTRKLGEPERELMYIVLRGRAPPKIHRWKRTNPVTQHMDGVWRDTFQCRRCKVTGHRDGLFGPVERDSKYSSQMFAHCDVAAGQVGRMQANGKDYWKNHLPPIGLRIP